MPEGPEVNSTDKIRLRDKTLQFLALGTIVAEVRVFLCTGVWHYSTDCVSSDTLKALCPSSKNDKLQENHFTEWHQKPS